MALLRRGTKGVRELLEKHFLFRVLCPAFIKELERNIAKIKLSKDWTKSTSAFVTYVSHLLSDHLGMNPRPASGAHLYTDEWYIGIGNWQSLIL